MEDSFWRAGTTLRCPKDKQKEVGVVTERNKGTHDSQGVFSVVGITFWIEIACRLRG